MAHNDSVVCRGRLQHLWSKRFWLVATPASRFLFHNGYINEGLVVSASKINHVRGIGRAASPYVLRPAPNDQEAAWEKVRLARARTLPSRTESLFLYDDVRVIRYMLEQWFPGEQRPVLEARVVKGSRLHKADMRWLDCTREEWPDLARLYWAGEMTADPLPEVLVDGAVYFPRWREPPFGVGAGIPK